MINLTQVILVIVITILTIMLTFIGIQVIYILKDLRDTLGRFRKIIDNAEIITSAVVKPVAGFAGLVEGIQSSLKIAELLGYVKKKLPEKVAQAKAEIGAQIEARRDHDETDQSFPLVPPPSAKHFFHRDGSPLRPS